MRVCNGLLFCRKKDPSEAHVEIVDKPGTMSFKKLLPRKFDRRTGDEYSHGVENDPYGERGSPVKGRRGPGRVPKERCNGNGGVQKVESERGAGDPVDEWGVLQVA